MSKNCNGNLIALTHFGNPIEALSFWNIYKLAGKIAISNAIIPQAAYFDNCGIQSEMPKIISAAPLSKFISFGLEK